jgi:hypothetical protein
MISSPSKELTKPVGVVQCEPQPGQCLCSPGQAEVAALLSCRADKLTDDGRQRLAEAAEKSWRRLDGHNQLPKVILGVKFTDGMEIFKSQAKAVVA